MKILLINTDDIHGGAAKIAFNLHLSLISRNQQVNMIVKRKASTLDSVIEIPKSRWFELLEKIESYLPDQTSNVTNFLSRSFALAKNPFWGYSRLTGSDNFYTPELKRLIKSYSDWADVFHLHNLHGNYFDLRLLPAFSKQKPIIITMHDEYLYTGHCAYTLVCERWHIGCGKCPHLDVYPDVRVDNTNHNWQRNKRIFQNSKVHLVTPSKWLEGRVKDSLLSHLPVKVIPNGIDLKVFKPGSKIFAREKLGLEKGAYVILFAAVMGRQNQFKDYDMLDRVIDRLKSYPFNQKVVLLALGGSQESEKEFNGVTLIEKPYSSDPKEIARYYQACDLYIHTAKADNAPLVILEAMACGKPIVATSAGGIPELVHDGETGFTVSIGDDEAMVERIQVLIDNPDIGIRMGNTAAEIARKEYDLEQMVKNYIDLYKEVIDERNK